MNDGSQHTPPHIYIYIYMFCHSFLVFNGLNTHASNTPDNGL